MNEQELDVKQIKAMPLELKELKEDGTFSGYGSIFGNVDSYNDVVVKGAFTKYLDSHTPADVKLLYQHDSTKPVGLFTIIKEDDRGLYVEGKLLKDDLAAAKEAYALLKAKVISGLSIGFTMYEGGTEYKDGVRFLTAINLWEISIVTFPANDKALVSNVKSIVNVRDFETFLRDVGGFSQARAKYIASHGFVGGLQREVEDEANTKLMSDIRSILMSTLDEGIKSL